jgi:glucose/mannose-6-phosphate isomerase
MEEAIKQFNTQFAYEPEIENVSGLKRTGKFIVCGMGGSHLAADLLKVYDPYIDLLIHRDYGLPRVPEYFLEGSLLILSSYSGNTEEVIDAFHKGLERNLNLAALSTGGQLIKLAKGRDIPYVSLPEKGIQPRSALGYSMKGLLKIMGEEKALAELSMLANTIDPSALREEGEAVARALKGMIPVIYASTLNLPIAYNWKIKMNETGKIPAFYNVFPELNHNEMTGFDVKDASRELSERVAFIFLRDESDDPRIIKRMESLEGLYKDRGLPVQVLEMSGGSVFEKIFSSLLLADWVAYYTARQYGLEAEQVPMVEEFKRLIAGR